MPLRRSSVIFIFMLMASIALLASFADAVRLRSRDMFAIDLKREMVTRLQLTDLALFTEARYTRHPSQADLHSAFMDHPFALEHFPSGSLIGPPPTLIDAHETVVRETDLSD